MNYEMFFIFTGSGQEFFEREVKSPKVRQKCG